MEGNAMRKLITNIIALLLFASSGQALAWWGGNGWDWNPWPVWTPMYWMEEMVGDDDWYGPYGYGGYGGYPYGGYGGYPYGGGYGYPYAGYGTYPYYGGGYANPWR